MNLYVYAAIFLLFAGTARAQVLPPGFPPSEDVDRALDSYPAVVAGQARIDSARATANMLRAGSHEFILSGAFSRRTIEREGRFAESDVTLSRTVRLPGKAGLDRKVGELGIDVAENLSEDMRHQAALLLSERWHDWLLAGELVRSDTQALAMQDAALGAIERRKDLRDAAQIDLDQARAARAVVEAQLADSRSLLEKARVTLSAIFPEIPLDAEPPGLATPQLPAQDLGTLRALVIDRSHEILASEREAQRLSVVASRARADRLPDPTVGVRMFRERGGLEHGVGVSLSVPLGWGYRSAGVRRASAEATAAEYDLAEVRRAIQAIADADVSEVRTRIAAWNSMAVSARSAAEVAARTQRGQQLGAIDLSDLLYIQKQANDARRAEIVARDLASRAVLKIQIDSHVIWAPAHHDDVGP